MQFSISLRCYGVTFEIATDTRELDSFVGRSVPRMFPAASVVTSTAGQQIYSISEGRVCGSGRRFLVRRRERSLGFTPSEVDALDYIRSDVQFTAARNSVDRTFVHAGVVGWGEKAIVLPGRSFSGKTTLVAALLERGATYYSDEYAVFTADGLVYPFVCPLHMRSARGHSRHLRTAEELAAERGVAPIPVGVILLTQYYPAAVWAPVRLTPGNALLHLLDNALPARSSPVRTMQNLGSAVLTAPAFRAERPDARSTAERIIESSNTSWFHQGSGPCRQVTS
jgi:hypothetical protein